MLKMTLLQFLTNLFEFYMEQKFTLIFSLYFHFT
jgi:hypothetical protein